MNSIFILKILFKFLTALALNIHLFCEYLETHAGIFEIYINSFLNTDVSKSTRQYGEPIDKALYNSNS